MTPYWLMYLLPALPALTSKGGIFNKKHTIFLAFSGFLFALFIGFRHQVGGDWGSYIFIYARTVNVNLMNAITTTDPGYAFLNWLMADWGFGIYAVNFICGGIFMTGLLVFARQQPYPWIAFAVAVPYLITVVAMGYSRQGVALGILFLALSSLEKGNFKQYLFFIVAATLFHKTALIMIPIGLFLYGRGWIIRAIAVFITIFVLWDLLLAGEEERLWEVYVTDQMISQGARIRVWMNFVPSLLLLLYLRSWKKLFPNYWFWFLLAVGSMVGIILVDIASTAVDRVALYFTPIQVAVFSRLPYLTRKQISPQILRFGIVIGYALVLFVWLNYASHAQYWLPYKSVIFL